MTSATQPFVINPMGYTSRSADPSRSRVLRAAANIFIISSICRPWFSPGYDFPTFALAPGKGRNGVITESRCQPKVVACGHHELPGTIVWHFNKQSINKSCHTSPDPENLPIPVKFKPTITRVKILIRRLACRCNQTTFPHMPSFSRQGIELAEAVAQGRGA